MRRLCVIGDPIHHSLSPRIQNAMLRAAGLDYIYDARRVAGEETGRWLEQAVREGYGGFNATMPHKENLVRLVDELSCQAARLGSVNTVCIRQGRTYGYSTDGAGLLRAMEQADMDPAGRGVLVLGAGGAARAAVFALVQAGADRITVANRTPERARQLCGQIGDPRVCACGFAPETLREQAAHSSLVVNCTSLGMTGTRGQFDDLSFLEALEPGAGVYDLIYSPAVTPLLQRGRELGLNTANGLGMLVWQGVYALELFVEQRLDRQAMARAAYDALEGIV